MPLMSGDNPHVISENIRMMKQEGRDEPESVAIAMSEAGKAKKPKGHPMRHKNLGKFLHAPKK